MNTFSRRSYFEVFVAAVLAAVCMPASAQPTAANTVPSPTPAQCATAPSYPLPLPSSLKQAAFQNYDVTMYNF
ncbi:MAG: hypothetical protein HY255_08715, partial [Betaproteobacteria bacterium]|nr:hypothetical protein [Betaproteobacteria bacterium]